MEIPQGAVAHRLLLPETGFLRLHQIIGRPGITEEKARANQEHNEQAKKQAIAKNRLDANGKPIYTHRPTKPRQPIVGIFPVSPASWWDGIKAGRYPKQVRLGPNTVAWRVEDIRSLIEQMAAA